MGLKICILLMTLGLSRAMQQGFDGASVKAFNGGDNSPQENGLTELVDLGPYRIDGNMRAQIHREAVQRRKDREAKPVYSAGSTTDFKCQDPPSEPEEKTSEPRATETVTEASGMLIAGGDAPSDSVDFENELDELSEVPQYFFRPPLDPVKEIMSALETCAREIPEVNFRDCEIKRLTKQNEPTCPRCAGGFSHKVEMVCMFWGKGGATTLGIDIFQRQKDGKFFLDVRTRSDGMVPGDLQRVRSQVMHVFLRSLHECRVGDDPDFLDMMTQQIRDSQTELRRGLISIIASASRQEANCELMCEHGPFLVEVFKMAFKEDEICCRYGMVTLANILSSLRGADPEKVMAHCQQGLKSIHTKLDRAEAECRLKGSISTKGRRPKVTNSFEIRPEFKNPSEIRDRCADVLREHEKARREHEKARKK